MNLSLGKLRRTLKGMPMLRIFFAVACGMLFCSRFALPGWFLAGCILLGGVLTVLLRSDAYAFLLLFAAGAFAAELHEPGGQPPHGRTALFRLCVDGEPAPREGYTSARAEVAAWKDAADVWHGAECRVTLHCDSTVVLRDGERLWVLGRLRPYSARRPFYASLMQRRGFAGVLYVGERNLLRRDTLERSSSFVERLHAAAVERFGRLRLPPDVRAVGAAMSVGDRSTLSPALREAYARSGTAHLLAVSGLHVGMVFFVVNLLLWPLVLLRHGHVVRNLAVILFVWLYALCTGASPSVLRAAGMFSALQFALAFSVEYRAVNWLAGTGVVMLLLHPAWLFDISFQLSFLAVAAILCWGVPLIRRFPHGWKRWLGGVLTTGFCAAVATAPLVSLRFGVVTPAGILVNPAVILLAQMIVGLAVLWVALPFAWLRPLFERTLGGLVGLQNGLAVKIAGWECMTIDYSMPPALVAVIYALFGAITLAVWSVERKKSVFLQP